MKAQSPPPPPINGVTMGILGLCLIAVVAAGFSLIREWQTVEAEARVLQQGHYLAVSDPRAMQIAPPPLLSAPSRVLLADALYIGRTLPDGNLNPRQQQLADRAWTEVSTAIRQNPRWGEAWAAAAFLSTKRSGPWANSTRIAIERSYLLAPYLRSSAAWRTAYGFANWDTLSESSKDRLVNEAVWLARIDNRSRWIVFSLARSSDGYAPFMLQWIRSREGDVDFQAMQRAAP